MNADRLEPARPLPPYTYVPGRAPHPKSDPAGHAYGRDEPRLALFDPAHLEASPDFRYGVDLFHAGYYWEAHEVWESLWHAVGHHGPTADLLKGLIKLAAAGVKVLEGVPNGVARHCYRAAELLDQAHRGGIARIGRTSTEELAATARALSVSPTTGCLGCSTAEASSHPRPVWPLMIAIDDRIQA